MNPIRTFATLLFLSLLGCANSATTTYSYVDPTASKKDLHSVMVIAVATTNVDRLDFERVLTKVLNGKGVRAIASHTLVPGDDVTAEQAIAAAIENKLDTIMVTRYVGETEEEIYHPGTVYYGVTPMYGAGRAGFGGYYGHAYEMAYDPAVTTTNRTITLVSDLYEVATEEHLWQVVSDAIKAGTENELRDTFIAAFVKDLQAKNVLD